MRQDITQDINPHAKSQLPHFRGISMHLWVLPSVPQIRFIGQDGYEPSLMKESVELGRFIVMLMHLWQPKGKVIVAVKDRMIIRYEL